MSSRNVLPHLETTPVDSYNVKKKIVTDSSVPELESDQESTSYSSEDERAKTPTPMSRNDDRENKLISTRVRGPNCKEIRKDGTKVPSPVLDSGRKTSAPGSGPIRNSDLNRRRRQIKAIWGEVPTHLQSQRLGKHDEKCLDLQVDIDVGKDGEHDPQKESSEKNNSQRSERREQVDFGTRKNRKNAKEPVKRDIYQYAELYNRREDWTVWPNVSVTKEHPRPTRTFKSVYGRRVLWQDEEEAKRINKKYKQQSSQRKAKPTGNPSHLPLNQRAYPSLEVVTVLFPRDTHIEARSSPDRSHSRSVPYKFRPGTSSTRHSRKPVIGYGKTNSLVNKHGYNRLETIDPQYVRYSINGFEDVLQPSIGVDDILQPIPVDPWDVSKDSPVSIKGASPEDETSIGKAGTGNNKTKSAIDNLENKNEMTDRQREIKSDTLESPGREINQSVAQYTQNIGSGETLRETKSLFDIVLSILNSAEAKQREINQSAIQYSQNEGSGETLRKTKSLFDTILSILNSTEAKQREIDQLGIQYSRHKGSGETLRGTTSLLDTVLSILNSTEAKQREYVNALQLPPPRHEDASRGLSVEENGRTRQRANYSSEELTESGQDQHEDERDEDLELQRPERPTVSFQNRSRSSIEQLDRMDTSHLSEEGAADREDEDREEDSDDSQATMKG